MAYTIDKDEIIDYPPEALHEFHLDTYEWIDNLYFIRPPEDFLPREKLQPYLDIVRDTFLKAGWEGTGEIGLLWLPPFIFHSQFAGDTRGVVLWFVKQREDGIAWMLSPVELPFEKWHDTTA